MFSNKSWPIRLDLRGINDNGSEKEQRAEREFIAQFSPSLSSAKRARLLSEWRERRERALKAAAEVSKAASLVGKTGHWETICGEGTDPITQIEWSAIDEKASVIVLHRGENKSCNLRAQVLEALERARPAYRWIPETLP